MINFLLLKYPEGISTKDSYGRTLIRSSMQEGHIEATTFLHQAFPWTALDRNSNGYLPIDVIRKEDVELMKVYLDMVLSCSVIGPSFVKELFNHHIQRNNTTENIPQWERRDSSWCRLIDKLGSDSLRDVQVFKTHPIILASIGKVPVTEVEFMMDLLKVNLAELSDDQGRGILTTIIKASGDGEDHWISYFKPLLELVNTRLHVLDAYDNRLRAKGNGAFHNILHNAALNGMSWYALGSICEINEDSLIIPHDESGLYPFMLPCATIIEEEDNIDSEGEDLLMRCDLTYQMLLMRPDVIKIATKDDGKDTFSTSNHIEQDTNISVCRPSKRQKT